MSWTREGLASPLSLGEAGGNGCTSFISVQSLVRPPWLRHGDCRFYAINSESKYPAGDSPLVPTPGQGTRVSLPGMWFQLEGKLSSPSTQEPTPWNKVQKA